MKNFIKYKGERTVKKELDEKDIKLLYAFRDKLTRELWVMNKNEEITKGQMIEFVYEKLTGMISSFDEKR